MSTTIGVTGPHPSTITVGRDLGFAPIAAALDEAVVKVLIIHARPLAARAVALAEHLRSLGYEVATADHPDAEAGKAIEVVAGLWDTCGHLQLGRKDVIIAMGGGATTDMAGFVAATWLRGVTLINVPTTLLGMVDAAVGGKTGINTSVGKNLVGSFYPADAVIADMSLLATLPRQDLARSSSVGSSPTLRSCASWGRPPRRSSLTPPASSWPRSLPVRSQSRPASSPPT